MRTPLVVNVTIYSVISVLLALGAGQAPAEPPAALQRQHLQVLTSVPESQLFPMMNAIADSLGVRCDYCHVRSAPDPTKTWSLAGGWIWDRDDKPPKLAARGMMRMVADINARQFGGRAIVSCYTCHRGSVSPVTFPPLPPRPYSTAPEPLARPLPSADEVWSAYLRAVGATRRFETLVMSATDDRSEGRHGTFDVVFKGTGRFRATLRMPPDGPVTQGLTGDSGWLASDSGSRAVRPAELELLRRAAQRYAVVKADRPANLQIAKMERLGDRDAYVAVSEVSPQTTVTLFFDVATGLLLRERTTTATSFIPLQAQVDYEDYRNVDGVMLPFLIRSSDGSPFDTSVKVFTSVRHDVDVDDRTFQPPAAAPRAGERFKSVRVLTDMPAALMIPMAFVSNSLGVTCLHCHTDLYESDEKPMKDKARQMIRMTRAINDTQFSGKRGNNGRTPPVSEPFELYHEKPSALRLTTALSQSPEVYDFGDFARIDGVMVPKRIVWSRADYQVTVSRITQN